MTHPKPVHTSGATVGGGKLLSLARQRELAEEEDMTPKELADKRAREKREKLRISARHVGSLCVHSPDPDIRTTTDRLGDGR